MTIAALSTVLFSAQYANATSLDLTNGIKFEYEFLDSNGFAAANQGSLVFDGVNPVTGSGIKINTITATDGFGNQEVLSVTGGLVNFMSGDYISGSDWDFEGSDWTTTGTGTNGYLDIVGDVAGIASATTGTDISAFDPSSGLTDSLAFGLLGTSTAEKVGTDGVKYTASGVNLTNIHLLNYFGAVNGQFGLSTTQISANDVAFPGNGFSGTITNGQVVSISITQEYQPANSPVTASSGGATVVMLGFGVSFLGVFRRFFRR